LFKENWPVGGVPISEPSAQKVQVFWANRKMAPVLATWKLSKVWDVGVDKDEDGVGCAIREILQTVVKAASEMGRPLTALRGGVG